MVTSLKYIKFFFWPRTRKVGRLYCEYLVNKTWRVSKHTFWEPQTWIQKKCRWRGFRDSLLHKWSMLWFHVDLKKLLGRPTKKHVNLKKTFRSTYEKTFWDGCHVKKKKCLGRPTKNCWPNFRNISDLKMVLGKYWVLTINFFTTVCAKKTFNFTRGKIKSTRFTEDSPRGFTERIRATT